MKKLSVLCIVFCVCLIFGLGNSLAQPSAKATAQLGSVKALTMADGWKTIFKQKIKTAQSKDLFIDVSLECGLSTDTKVISKALEKALASAKALVRVRIKVDGMLVPVNESLESAITFAKRKQTLIAEFGGDISTCGVDGDGAVVITEECLLPETLQLILKTMTANSYNFILPDLDAGEHTVKVQAKLLYSTETGEDINPDLYPGEAQAAAKAYLGNGSVTIQTVRMIKDENVVVDLE